ncbi:MAG: AraC family transcriptional regulator, partial [Clostridia bacterium]
GETMQTLRAGQAMLYAPQEKQYYVFAPEDDAEVCWFHFTGSGVTGLLADCGMARGAVYEIGELPEVRHAALSIIRELQRKTALYQVACTAHFLQLLTLMGRRVLGQSVAPGRMEDVLDALHLDFKKDVPMEVYATMCHMSACHFSRRFKAYTGHCPQEYRILLRLDMAKDLLRHTTMTVGEIAQTVGYDNGLYFSRLFSKYIGEPPTRFREG